jgi:sortase A
MPVPVKRCKLKKYFSILMIALFLCTGLFFLGKGLFIFAKAQLAQVLLEGSWKAVLEGKEKVKPWPWADFTPVASLYFPDEKYKTIVVSGASGTSLAFAPGHLDGSAEPGTKGNCVIYGHRETHFRILENLVAGESIFLITQDGREKEYQVTDLRVIDKSETIVTARSYDERLTLVTCYPFKALAPGPKRYVVVAKVCD